MTVKRHKNTMKDLQNAEQRLTKVDSSLQRVNSLLLTGFRKRGTIDYEPSRKLIFFNSPVHLRITFITLYEYANFLNLLTLTLTIDGSSDQ